MIFNFWQSKKVRLRGVEPSDVEHFIRWDRNSDRARHLDFVWPPTSAAFVRAWAEEQAKRKLGWRGYALSRLLKNRSALFASLVVGVLWGLVHLALHLPGMPNESLPGVLTVFQLIGLSVLITWFFIQAGNRIVLTSLFHATQSFFVIVNDGITLSQQIWLMAAVWSAAAVIVVIASRSMQGSASPERG
ncbi:MAG: CPBP family intramembrane glutamic endopeptidase [Anaerolineales bacterium]